MCISCWQEYGSPKIINENVLSAVEVIRELYDESCVGGNLHIVVDDWNIEDENLAWCGAKELSDTEKKCFDALSLLSIGERASALAIVEELVGAIE